MNILERTTTEEYDEDGRLTSRTTVEKYDKGPSGYETANKAFESVLDMTYTERNLLFEKVVKYCKIYEPCVFQSALLKAKEEKKAQDCQANAFDNNVTAYN